MDFPVSQGFDSPFHNWASTLLGIQERARSVVKGAKRPEVLRIAVWNEGRAVTWLFQVRIIIIIFHPKYGEKLTWEACKLTTYLRAGNGSLQDIGACWGLIQVTHVRRMECLASSRSIRPRCRVLSRQVTSSWTPSMNDDCTCSCSLLVVKYLWLLVYKITVQYVE